MRGSRAAGRAHHTGAIFRFGSHPALGVRRKCNRRHRLARNSLFFANREFDHREQGNSVFETGIVSRLSEKSRNPAWVVDEDQVPLRARADRCCSGEAPKNLLVMRLSARAVGLAAPGLPFPVLSGKHQARSSRSVVSASGAIDVLQSDDTWCGSAELQHIETQRQI